MPRSSSNSSQSRTTHPVAQKQKQVQVQPQQPPQTQSQQVNVASSTGIFQSMKEGFGWGIGTSIARSMFGGGSASAAVAPVAPVVPVAPVTQLAPAKQSNVLEQHDQLIYNKCMEDTDNTHETCKQYIIYSMTNIAESNA